MSISSSFPYTLQNGVTADATQVMANFTSLQSDVNTNAAHNGSNSDITTLTALTSIVSTLLTLTGAITTTGNGTIGGNLAVPGTTTLTGNVGIGTAAASSKVTISHAQNALSYCDFYNTDTGSSAGVLYRLISSDVAGTGSSLLYAVKYKNGTAALWNTETNAAAYIGFGVGASERMRVDSSGRVGIGKTNPQAPLDVNGEIRGTQLSLTNNAIGEYSTNATEQVAINYVGYAGGTTQFRDLGVFDGKGVVLAYFQGSSGLTLIGGSSRAGATGEVVAKNTVKAWGVFNGTTGALTKGFNITSITKNATGDWTANLTTALPDANASCVVSGNDDGATAVIFNVASVSTTSARIYAKNPSNVAVDVTRISFVICD